MGEYADLLIDQMIDGWENRDEFFSKKRRGPTRVTCRHCGERDLRWQNIKGGAWRLHTKDGVRHVCRPPAIERAR